MNAQELGSYLLIGFVIMLVSRYFARKSKTTWNARSEYNGACLAFAWLAWPVFLVMVVCMWFGQVKK